MQKQRVDVPDPRTCPKGHSWTTSPADKGACPHCARKRPDKPLTVTHPEIAALWSATNRFPAEWVGAGTNRRCWFRCPNGHDHEFVSVVSVVASGGGSCAVCSGRQIRAGFNSLADQDPETAAQWHPDNALGADEVAPKSHIEALWRCSNCSHEWEQKVSKRTQIRGCPSCTGRALIPGKTDFATKYPQEAREWDSSNDLCPDEVTAGSGYYATWRCVDVHPDITWQATVNNRANGTGCPVCAGKRAVPGLNDAATLRPDLVPLWRGDRPLTEYTESSGREGRWACPVEGHPDYTMSIYTRAQQGCPACAGKKVVEGVNDLASQDPGVAARWSPSNAKRADEVTLGSRFLAYWSCPEEGHPDYRATVSAVVSRGYGCPICSGKRALPGATDLGTLYPHLVTEWDDEKDITTFRPGSDYKARWRCSEGHRWTAAIYSRAKAGNGCSRCANHVSRGETEMADFIRSILPEGAEVLTSDRRVIGPKELDIVVPSLKVAVEYNGVYWHSDRYRTPSFHRDKYLACKAAGYRLIQVWEDDWRDKRAAVEGLLVHVLGGPVSRRIGARETFVVDVPRDEAEAMLRQYHLQGDSGVGSRYLGLRDQSGGELVAVMAVQERGTERRIERYVTSVSVPGGFTRLLSCVEKELADSGGGKITTFSNAEVSEGSLYRDSGFSVDKVLDPEWSVVRDMTRENRRNYTAKRFRSDPALVFVPGMTPTQMVTHNNLPRVWDSGKVRWVKPVQPAS